MIRLLFIIGECLKIEPAHSAALYRSAELHYRRAEYPEALRLAVKILEKDTYDGSGNFILGIVLKEWGAEPGRRSFQCRFKNNGISFSIVSSGYPD